MIYLVGYDDGKIESYAALTRQNKMDYCDKHSYKYLLSSGVNRFEPELSPAWNLVAVVRQAMKSAQEGDWIFLLGADAAIVNMDCNLDWLVSPEINGYLHGEFKLAALAGADLLITRDKNGINTNGLLLRNCKWSRELIERWWDARGIECEIHTNDTYHWWAEQGYLFYLLGEEGTTGMFRYEGQPYGVFGVNDPLFNTKSFKVMPDVLEHVCFIPQQITNCYPAPLFGPDEAMEPVFVVHLPGKTTEERTAYFQKLLA